VPIGAPTTRNEADLTSTYRPNLIWLRWPARGSIIVALSLSRMLVAADGTVVGLADVHRENVYKISGRLANQRLGKAELVELRQRGWQLHSRGIEMSSGEEEWGTLIRLSARNYRLCRPCAGSPPPSHKQERRANLG
jgi:hypothetical protein